MGYYIEKENNKNVVYWEETKLKAFESFERAKEFCIEDFKQQVLRHIDNIMDGYWEKETKPFCKLYDKKLRGELYEVCFHSLDNMEDACLLDPDETIDNFLNRGQNERNMYRL